MAVVALCSLQTLLIKLICIVLRWKYIVYKTWSLCWENKAFLSENFIPVTQAGVFVSNGKSFLLVADILVFATETSVTRLAQLRV